VTALMEVDLDGSTWSCRRIVRACLYVLDRSRGKLMSATPFGPLTSSHSKVSEGVPGTR